MADRRPLMHEAPEFSESLDNTPALPSLGFSNNSHTIGLTSPSASRPNFARFQSDTTAVDRNTPSTVHEEDEEDEGAIADSFRRERGSGLGIASPGTSPQTAKRVSIQTIPRRAVGPGPKSPPTKSPGTFSPPGSADPYFGGFHRSSAESTPDLRRERVSPDVGSYESFQPGILKNAKQSSTSVNEYEAYLHSSDTDRLKRGAPSIKSAYESDFHPVHECNTRRDFYHPRFTWLNFSVVFCCVFSCVLSGLFLGLAIGAPRYGRRISSQGSFKPTDAIILTTIIAKLIEMSFVTVFVAFLGQVLSRRAFMKDHGRGVTLSELSMWRWIVQPGTVFTHPEAAKYAGFSFLGILSLLSAVLATLYTSAATAVVQPMLRDGNWDNGLVLSGLVKSDFANINYLKDLCKTPIRTDMVEGGNTCLQIEHAAQGYYNYQRYLAEWHTTVRHENGTEDQKLRPPGFGLLYENTTVTGQWINIINTTTVSKDYGRVINNVSLAMPHAGVFAAARDQRNGIMQPEELNSEGTYSLRASVPSPVMNVLCVNMKREELEPIVYSEWNTGEAVNISSWNTLSANATTKNNTKVDDIFGWNTSAEDSTDYPPVFARLPMPFNTLLNHTSAKWGRPAIYLLGQGGPADDGSDGTGTFALCKLHVYMTADCSTHHDVTGSGASMEAHCEDPHDKMAYKKSQPDDQAIRIIKNWRDVGFDWANSLSLNTGIMDANASNSRLLTQLILQPSDPTPESFTVALSKALPSLGEAVAVLSASTLLKSMIDAPFVMFWNYTRPTLDMYQTQIFNASLKAQQYASGGEPGASKAWIIILVLVFVMNIFVLIYFLFHRGLVTDFSEPPNLFALAVNSPPSHVLAGSCGGGPEGRQYGVNWFVKHEGNHLYMEPGEKTALLNGHGHVHVHAHGPTEESPPQEIKSGASVFASIPGAIKRSLRMKEHQAPTKLRRPRGMEHSRSTNGRPGSVASDYEMEDAQTRTERQYRKLANRRSLL